MIIDVSSLIRYYLPPHRKKSKRVRYLSHARLHQHKVNGYVVARFINKMLQHLEEFKHSDHNAQQCNNIEMARVSFIELKSAMYGESVTK